MKITKLKSNLSSLVIRDRRRPISRSLLQHENTFSVIQISNKLFGASEKSFLNCLVILKPKQSSFSLLQCHTYVQQKCDNVHIFQVTSSILVWRKVQQTQCSAMP